MRRMRKLVVCSALRDMIEPSSITIATVKSIIMKDLITRRELEAFSEPLIKDDLIKGMNLQMKTTKLEKLSREEALCRLVSAVNQYSLTQGETFCSQQSVKITEDEPNEIEVDTPRTASTEIFEPLSTDLDVYKNFTPSYGAEVTPETVNIFSHLEETQDPQQILSMAWIYEQELTIFDF